MPPAADTSTHPYDTLTPDLILDAVEALGLVSNGRVLALNSYENRVYQVGIEESEPVVLKFYRPGRWSTPAILEEHAFAFELAGAEVPVVAPLAGEGSLHELAGFRYAVYPRRGGRWPELGSGEEREWMGRFLGRMHAVGSRSRFRHRPTLSVESLGHDSVDYLLEAGWIPAHVEEAYASTARDLLERVEERFDQAGAVRELRLHGDCHPGNVLWTDAGPHFVDLDDCQTGPAIQDLWMLTSGTREEQAEQFGDLLAGYRRFADFDRRELALVEPLRSLRMLHYAAWLGRRWEDPAFRRAFPWFEEPRYWEQHVLSLREQLASIDEGPLELPQ
jgi:Ser/Thr protein kinase RdoA (MazF antagonist)